MLSTLSINAVCNCNHGSIILEKWPVSLQMAVINCNEWFPSICIGIQLFVSYTKTYPVSRKLQINRGWFGLHKDMTITILQNLNKVEYIDVFHTPWPSIEKLDWPVLPHSLKFVCIPSIPGRHNIFAIGPRCHAKQDPWNQGGQDYHLGL